MEEEQLHSRTKSKIPSTHPSKEDDFASDLITPVRHFLPIELTRLGPGHRQKHTHTYTVFAVPTACVGPVYAKGARTELQALHTWAYVKSPSTKTPQQPMQSLPVRNLGLVYAAESYA